MRPPTVNPSPNVPSAKAPIAMNLRHSDRRCHRPIASSSSAEAARRGAACARHHPREARGRCRRTVPATRPPRSECTPRLGGDDAAGALDDPGRVRAQWRPPSPVNRPPCEAHRPAAHVRAAALGHAGVHAAGRSTDARGTVLRPSRRSSTRASSTSASGGLFEELEPYAASLPPDSDDAALIRVAWRDWDRERRVPTEPRRRDRAGRGRVVRRLGASPRGIRLRGVPAVARADHRPAPPLHRVLRTVRRRVRRPARGLRARHEDIRDPGDLCRPDAGAPGARRRARDGRGRCVHARPLPDLGPGRLVA